MNKKFFTKVFITTLVFIFTLGLVAPAKAFYMEVPQSLKNVQFQKISAGVMFTSAKYPTGVILAQSSCVAPLSGCPSGGWFDNATCTCQFSNTTPPPPTTQPCPDGTSVPVGTTCPTTPPPGCSPPLAGCGSNSTWDQAGCYCRATYTPPPPTNTCVAPSSGCPSGGWFDSSTCTCQSSGNMNCTAPSAGCGMSSWWDNSTCSCKPNAPTTCTAPQAGCGYNSFWNQSTCSCSAQTCSEPPMGCGDNGPWNQSTCSCQGGTPNSCAAPSAGCGMNSWWDRSTCSCKSSTPQTCSSPPNGCGMNSYWDQAGCFCKSNDYQQQQQPYNQQQQQQPYNQQQQMGPQEFGPNQMGPNQQGPNPEQQEMDAQRMKEELRRMKKNATQMQNNLKRLEKAFADGAKKGITIPQEILDQLAKAKAIFEAVKAATTLEELQEVDFGALGDIIQTLEQARQDIIESAQRLTDMRRGMKDMQRGLTSFEKQIAKLIKQKIGVPAELTETLTKIKAIVAAVNAAKTWDEAMGAGIDDLQDLMQSLDQYRQQMEMLARWPQISKDLNRQLTSLNTQLKQAKTVTARLAKKGIDVSDVYTAFEAAINKLKGVRDDATAKMQAGDTEELFNLLENEFFGQMEDTMEYFQTIMMMNNFGQFTAEFKRGITQSKQMIAKLKRQKIDTTELSNLLAEAQAKGDEIQALIKQRPVDYDAVTAGMEELWDLKQTFDDKTAELTGQETVMPWEKGQQIFNQVSMPNSIQSMIPQKPQQQQGPEGGMMGPGGGGGNQMGPGF